MALSEISRPDRGGIDARAGRVATRGWLEESSVDAVELGKRMGALGVQEIIYTDIARTACSVGRISRLEMARQTGLSVIASGVSFFAGFDRIEEIGGHCPRSHCR